MTFLTTAIIPIFDCPSSPNWPALGKPTRKRVPAAEAEGNLESGLCALTSDCAPWRHARSVHQETMFPRHRVNMTVFWIVVVLCEILAPLCLAAPLILKCMQDCSTPSPYKPHPFLSCLDVYPTRRARGLRDSRQPRYEMPTVRYRCLNRPLYPSPDAHSTKDMEFPANLAMLAFRVGSEASPPRECTTS